MKIKIEKPDRLLAIANSLGAEAKAEADFLRDIYRQVREAMHEMKTPVDAHIENAPQICIVHKEAFENPFDAVVAARERIAKNRNRDEIKADLEIILANREVIRAEYQQEINEANLRCAVVSAGIQALKNYIGQRNMQ
jgi:hypothetical protein